ncbi:11-oxo-beta-amyrin 30-oxidase, partial [Mucuna pruriens]
MVGVISIWTLQKMMNSVWLRPKRFERVLREQGLKGHPYSLFPHYSNPTLMQLNHSNSQPFTLSHDVALFYCHQICYTFSFSQHNLFFQPFERLLISKGCACKNSFLWQGTTPKVIITDRKQIKEVFNNMHDFHRPKLSGNAKFLRHGLLNYEGECHNQIL